MGDVLDNLFSIIPIVLVILWVLRRVSRQKTGGKAAQSQSSSSSDSSTEPKPEHSRLTRSLYSLEKRATRAIRNVRDEITGESTTERPSGEEELYERKEPRSVVVPRRHPQVEDTVERLVEDRSKVDEGKKYSGPEISNSFDRFRELPPLAQGMVWSIILDEPPALKEPKN